MRHGLADRPALKEKDLGFGLACLEIHRDVAADRDGARLANRRRRELVGFREVEPDLEELERVRVCQGNPRGRISRIAVFLVSAASVSMAQV